MSKNKTPQHEAYSTMEDTPWITQGRQIASAGGKGILDNYNNVNVFDQDTQSSLEARNNATYQRAFKNMSDEYAKSMNKYNAKNYNQFGTLNSTPSSYVTDQYQKDYQRQMDDMAYQKAANYDTLMDNELNRRYNTMNMFSNMYNYGQTPYQQDVANWNVKNTNKDIAYNNALAKAQNSSSFWDRAGNILGSVGATFGSSLMNNGFSSGTNSSSTSSTSSSSGSNSALMQALLSQLGSSGSTGAMMI